MEMQIEKMGLMRLENNPRSQELKLNVDWDLEYTHKSPYKMRYICNLRAIQKFPLKLEIEGDLNLESPNEFKEEKVSKIIIDKCLEILLEMINITKEHKFEINGNRDFVNNEFPIKELNKSKSNNLN